MVRMMEKKAADLLNDYLSAVPLVAILRGVKPDEVLDVSRILIGHGIRVIEVPLNSPEPFESIRRLGEALGDQCLHGAGTVLTPADVDRVADASGKLIVTPNSDVSVIRRTVERGLVPFPGFMTPTEAFAAIAAGARHIKLFPAATVGTGHLKAIKAVLPRDVGVYAVGGVGAAEMEAWRNAGAVGFGIGSEIYQPGRDLAEIDRRAAALVAACAKG